MKKTLTTLYPDFKQSADSIIHQSFSILQRRSRLYLNAQSKDLNSFDEIMMKYLCEALKLTYA